MTAKVTTDKDATIGWNVAIDRNGGGEVITTVTLKLVGPVEVTTESGQHLAGTN